MKKIIVATAISFPLLFVQSCDNKKDIDDKEIPVSEVPAPVQSAFSAKYSTASNVKWEDANEDTLKTYKAKFTLNGEKMKAEFDADGVLIKGEEDN